MQIEFFFYVEYLMNQVFTFFFMITALIKSLLYENWPSPRTLGFLPVIYLPPRELTNHVPKKLLKT